MVKPRGSAVTAEYLVFTGIAITLGSEMTSRYLVSGATARNLYGSVLAKVMAVEKGPHTMLSVATADHIIVLLVIKSPDTISNAGAPRQVMLPGDIKANADAIAAKLLRYTTEPTVVKVQAPNSVPAISCMRKPVAVNENADEAAKAPPANSPPKVVMVNADDMAEVPYRMSVPVCAVVNADANAGLPRKICIPVLVVVVTALAPKPVVSQRLKYQSSQSA